MAPGALPRPGRVPEHTLMSPKICLRWRRRCGTVSGKNADSPRVFRPRGFYVGEGASSRGLPGRSSHIGGAARGQGRAALLCEGRPRGPTPSLSSVSLEASVNF